MFGPTKYPRRHDDTSSNINEVIRAVLNFFFFLRKDFARTKKHQKAQKHKKHKNATKQKHKNANKRTKIKNALKKHLRGKKSLIRLFEFLCLQRKVSTIEMLVSLN